MAAPSLSPTERRRSLRDLHAADMASQDVRAGIALLVIYLVDALLFAGFCSFGLASWVVPALFACTGITVAGGCALAVARSGKAQLSESNAVLGQSTVALLLTLGVAWSHPSLATLMLLTVVVILPTAALRLSPRRLLVLAVLAALGCAAVVNRHGGQLTVPAASPGQQVLTGVFFLWTLIKGASVNLLGMSMRLALDESHAKLADALARVEVLAQNDELTGLANRRRILEVLAGAREQRSRVGQPYGIAMLDIDYFKRINDTFGHALGDEVLRRVARLMQQETQDGEAAGRIGGEEFLVVLPGAATLTEAKLVAERLRLAVERHNWSSLQPELKVTASIGLAIGGVGEAAEHVLQRADQGLYQAKRSGRNRVSHVASPPLS